MASKMATEINSTLPKIKYWRGKGPTLTSGVISQPPISYKKFII